jgi:hypothetical protein
MTEKRQQIEPHPVRIVGFVNTKTANALAASFRHTTISTNLSAICGENKQRSSIIIKNLSVDTVWIGDRHLVPGIMGAGYPLCTRESIRVTDNIGEIFAATEANSSLISIIEE